MSGGDKSVRISNANILNTSDDSLYHFGIVRSTTNIPEVFGDVKFVCTGGSAQRIEWYAEMFARENNFKISENLSKSDRFVLYKSGPVLWVNHGMGTPSTSIMLNELIKLLYYAKAKNVILFRIGTSGGLGVEPGTILISSGCCNGQMEEGHVQYILGKKVLRPAVLDAEITKQLCALASEMNLPNETGKTMSADDFYEGQGRLDGAFCEYTASDKFAFLKKLHEHGVRNIEMEATCVAALLNRANIRVAVVCVILLNRLKGDQVELSKKVYEDFELRPYKLVTRFILNKLKEK